VIVAGIDEASLVKNVIPGIERAATWEQRRFWNTE
jgi:hypothetical protein